MIAVYLAVSFALGYVVGALVVSGISIANIIGRGGPRGN